MICATNTPLETTADKHLPQLSSHRTHEPSLSCQPSQKVPAAFKASVSCDKRVFCLVRMKHCERGSVRNNMNWYAVLLTVPADLTLPFRHVSFPRRNTFVCRQSKVPNSKLCKLLNQRLIVEGMAFMFSRFCLLYAQSTGKHLPAGTTHVRCHEKPSS